MSNDLAFWNCHHTKWITDETRRAANRRRRQARRNWYRKFSLVDARARSDPRLQSSSSNSSSTSTLRADPSHVLLSDFLELGPVTSVSAPAINEVEEYTAGHLGNSNNFGRAYLMLPWKAMNKRRHSWICR